MENYTETATTPSEYKVNISQANQQRGESQHLSILSINLSIKLLFEAKNKCKSEKVARGMESYFEQRLGGHT